MAHLNNDLQFTNMMESMEVPGSEINGKLLFISLLCPCLDSLTFISCLSTIVHVVTLYMIIIIHQKINSFPFCKRAHGRHACENDNELRTLVCRIALRLQGLYSCLCAVTTSFFNTKPHQNYIARDPVHPHTVLHALRYIIQAFNLSLKLCQ